MKKKNKYCGYISIIGKTNVGKSTLLNTLIKNKISIISSKSNTTNQPIIGIQTKKLYQFIYIDTPGFKNKKCYQHNKKIINFIKKSCIIIFVIKKMICTHEDILFLKKIKNKKILLVINKIDCIYQKKKLLPYIQYLYKKTYISNILPISAKKNINIKRLKKIIQKNLPIAKHIYSKKTITDKKKNFLIIEIIREKLLKFLWKEIPYTSSIHIENIFKNIINIYIINILILVKNNNQKKIIIGKNGKNIKKIKFYSKKDIEKYLKNKVSLRFFIKIL